LSKTEFAAFEAILADQNVAVPSVATAPDVNEASSQPKIETPVFDFVETNFDIRKSFLNPGDQALPAKFSWVNSAGSDAFYSLDLAVLVTPEFLRGPNWWIAPGFEAHTSTEDGKAQDSLSYRVPAVLTLAPRTAIAPNTGDVVKQSNLFSQHYFAISPVWETDRDQEVETFGGDLFYTFSIPELAIGSEVSIADFLQFRWRPWIGVEAGSIEDHGNSPELIGQDDFFRVVPKVSADMLFGDSFRLAAEYTYRSDLRGSHNDYGFFETSAIWDLDPAPKKTRTSIGLTYKLGETTPQFKEVDTLSAWFGLKF